MRRIYRFVERVSEIVKSALALFTYLTLAAENMSSSSVDKLVILLLFICISPLIWLNVYVFGYENKQSYSMYINISKERFNDRFNLL